MRLVCCCERFGATPSSRRDRVRRRRCCKIPPALILRGVTGCIARVRALAAHTAVAALAVTLRCLLRRCRAEHHACLFDAAPRQRTGAHARDSNRSSDLEVRGVISASWRVREIHARKDHVTSEAPHATLNSGAQQPARAIGERTLHTTAASERTRRERLESGIGAVGWPRASASPLPGSWLISRDDTPRVPADHPRAGERFVRLAPAMQGSARKAGAIEAVSLTRARV